VSEAIQEFKIGDQVAHRALIIPGMGARFKGEIEDLSGWDVYVGPKDSGGIGDFLKEKYKAVTGLKYVGDPGKESPVILTSNNIKSFYDVKKPLLDAKASVWLVVVDTEGLDIATAVKEKKLDAAAVKKVMDEGDADKQITKKELIIPPAAESLKTSIESATKWKAKVVAPDKLAGTIKK
jgi:CO dehydrogenase/acetyl-CoA synthase gamma subunit (corrinoid Fe-S protein)